MRNALVATIEFITANPKFEEEKPYEVRYDIKGVIPSSKFTSEPKDVILKDGRHLQASHAFEELVFSVEKTSNPLTNDVFGDQESIKDLYYPDIKRILKERFPGAAQVHVLEHNLCRRHPMFPNVEDVFVQYTQPAVMSHVGFTLQSAIQTAYTSSGIEPGKYQRMVSVNFWKSLQKTGNDWPLAFCDARTIDPKERVAVDVVYHNRFTESERLYHNPKQEWFYFKDIAVKEIIMFLQKDSNIDEGGGVGHASFYKPEAGDNSCPLTSIEFRAFAFCR